MKVFIEPNCVGITPPRAGDAGYDLYAKEGLTLNEGFTAQVRTGVYVQIPEGFVGLIHDRSSMANLGVQTLGGVIDSSYRGEIVLILQMVQGYNLIKPGQKIAQMIVVPIHTQFERVVNRDELGETIRHDRGFGSTDA